MHAHAVPFASLASAVAHHRPALVVSITDPGRAVPDEIMMRLVGDTPVMRLEFSPFDREPNAIWITRDMMRPIIAAAQDLPEDAQVVVHCTAGEVRSPAMALVIDAARQPDTDMYTLVQNWRKRHPHANPHERTMAIGEDLLDHRRRSLSMTLMEVDTDRNSPKMNNAAEENGVGVTKTAPKKGSGYASLLKNNKKRKWRP